MRIYDVTHQRWFYGRRTMYLKRISLFLHILWRPFEGSLTPWSWAWETACAVWGEEDVIKERP